jgi:endonuclease/exonuclease/phosphatase family metal-dependent hydrolase
LADCCQFQFLKLARKCEVSDLEIKQVPISMKIATWNVNRPVGATRREAARVEIDRVAADVLVLTETHDGFDSGFPFSCSSAEGRDGNYQRPHRWVTIWSKYRLEKLATSDPIRTTAARIFPSDGAPFLVFGTVLPWRNSVWGNPPYHGAAAFDEALKVQVFDWKNLHCQYPNDELFVLGDFNQDLAITPYCGTKVTRAILSSALKDCDLVALTAGESDPVRRDLKKFACIDHICAFTNSRWKLLRTERWPNTAEPKEGPSDHFGIAVLLASVCATTIGTLKSPIQDASNALTE